jgi:hypothetical protein
MLGKFLVAAQLAASQEGLSSMELVIIMKDMFTVCNACAIFSCLTPDIIVINH